MMILLLIVLFKLSVCFSQQVDTKFGIVKGETRITKDGSSLFVFYGIPYAAKLTSELRFKESQEFTGTYPNNYLLATQPTKCVQFNMSGSRENRVSGQEDCLHLNIYTTSLNSNSKYDVIFYIHGGEFVHGSGHTQSPEYLFDFNKELVFVSINYRLGPFGFLTTGDDVVPGNMGLKDQVVALKWVKNNIKRFGGNPNNVILIGASSGGVCVHLHYLSPMSRGLFTGGISMGGAALSRDHNVANVPWILGMSSSEGLLPAAEYILNEDKARTLDTNWNKMAPYLLTYVGYASNDDLDRISQEVRAHYLGRDPISRTSQDKLVKLLGDRLHYLALENSLRLHVDASKANTYMYMFDYKGTQSFTNVIYGSQTYLGVCHSDDLIYLLKMRVFKQKNEDETVQRMMMNMWRSFVQSGIPDLGNGVKWPPVPRHATSSNIKYMLIDGEAREMSKPSLSDRAFWDSLPIEELHLSGVPYIPKYFQVMNKRKKTSFFLLTWVKKHFSWLNIFKKKSKESKS